MDSNEDMTLLKEIQKNLLLGEIPQDIKGVALAVSTVASEKIDSDFYEVIAHQEGVFDVILGDVMGKGVKAQVLAAQIKELIPKENLILSEEEEGLASISSITTRVTDKLLPKLKEEEVFATLFYARFDLGQMTLSYLDFGYTRSILLKKSGDRHFLKTDYLPLGIAQEEKIKAEVLHLEVGDKIVLYSDGLTEATNREGEHFGFGNIQAAVELCKEKNCQEIVSYIFSQLGKFREGEPVKNDVTCMVIEVLPSAVAVVGKRPSEVVSRSLGIEEPVTEVKEEVQEEEPVIEAKEEAVIPEVAEIQEEKQFTPNLDGLEQLLGFVEKEIEGWPSKEKTQMKLVVQKLGVVLLQCSSKGENPSNIFLKTAKHEDGITLTFFYEGTQPVVEGLKIIQKNVNQVKVGQDDFGRHYLEISKRF